jgi:hypothetical protein
MANANWGTLYIQLTILKIFMRKLIFIVAAFRLLTSCSDPEYPVPSPITTPSTVTANVRVVHAIPDGGGVSVSVENAPSSLTSLTYLSSSPYFTIPSGGSRQIRLLSGSTTVRSANFVVSTGRNYTYFAVNKASATSSNTLVVTDNLSSPAAGKAHVRFLHLAPDAPEVKVTTIGGTETVFSRRRYLQTTTGSGATQINFTNFTPLDAGSYNLEVRKQSDDGIVLTLTGVQLEAGKIYTIYARGLVTNPATGQELGASILVHN